MNTNIKNLPDGTYYIELCYSDRNVWREVSRTAKTRTLARVKVVRDPDWQQEWYVGGFSGHCANQGSQTWLFDEVDTRNTIVIRETKKGLRREGVTFVEGARYFYDFNF